MLASGRSGLYGGIVALAAAAFTSILHAGAAPNQRPAALTPPASDRAVLDRYCVTCHNARLKTAGLQLDSLNLDSVAEGADKWEKVVLKLRTGAMPPTGAPRPDKDTYTRLASRLERALDDAAAARPNPGRPTLHRLNRAEYTNAIRDLFDLEIDGRALLPADSAASGFDNLADVLTVSPAFLERYMLAATTIVRTAMGDSQARPRVETYTVTKMLRQNDRMSEDLPFGTRGGTALRHYFPVDGEYEVKVRLQRTFGEMIKGLDKPHRLDVRVDGALVTSFTVGGGETELKAGAVFDPTPYQMTADSTLNARFQVKAGTHTVGVAFVKMPTRAEGLRPERLVGFALESDPGREPDVATVQIGGPYQSTGVGDTPSRQRIFLCRPSRSGEEEGCARRILTTIATRAYRRPLAPADVESLMTVYRAGRRDSTFAHGIEMGLRRILVSPNFLFRIERDPAGAPPASVHRLSDLELASRLSFFLWSSIPDDQLLNAARQGALRDPAALERQVRRMIADPKSKALTVNFAGQWLMLRNLRLISPDSMTYGEFDDTLREALRTETELFFDSLLREDRSVVALLDANYTYLNERLAEHYGIPNIFGSHFRRVTLPEDSPRRGLLGHGSVLTVTSHANRTSVVLRGKWVLENVLGTPPPAPPPDVPPLRTTGADGAPATLRALMEQHRANPTCAACHARMDPLGFALETFDGIGQWRTHDAGSPIDASGTFADGTKFDGPAGLRKALLDRRDDFARALTEKLMMYALGRPVEYYDLPAIRQILRDAAPADYRWSSILLGIVKSMPFQMRRTAEPEPSLAAAVRR